jgi:hypothetical protein
MSESTMTVGELRRHLEGWPEDVKVSFSGRLTFCRLKRWGDHEVIVEFNEPQADLTPEFRKRNPQVKVAFIDDEATANSDGSISVSIR